MEPTRRIEQRIAEQYGLITRSQALACGLSRRQVDYRVRNGTWIPLGSGVYRARDRASHPYAPVLAATLQARGVAAQRTGGALLGLLDELPTRPEVVIEPHRTARGPFRVYRSTLMPGDTTRIGPIPSTSATRTLLDLGDRVPFDDLEEALHRALHRRLTSVPTLLARLDAAHRGHRGAAPLRRLLGQFDTSMRPVESKLELVLLEVLRRGGLPEPVRQFSVSVAGENYRLDLAYPGAMLFLEGDGFGVHTTRRQFELDRARQNALVVAGWVPLRFTWRQAIRGAEDVCEQVAEMLDRRRAA